MSSGSICEPTSPVSNPSLNPNLNPDLNPNSYEGPSLSASTSLLISFDGYITAHKDINNHTHSRQQTHNSNSSNSDSNDCGNNCSDNINSGSSTCSNGGMPQYNVSNVTDSVNKYLHSYTNVSA